MAQPQLMLSLSCNKCSDEERPDFDYMQAGEWEHEHEVGHFVVYTCPCCQHKITLYLDLSQ